MIGVIATLKCKDGTNADFEKATAELVAAVNANEPGCLFYRIFKTDEPNTYRFLEAYKDQDAVEAHRKSDHFRTLGKAMGAFMAGPPEVVRMQGVE
ncbi:MAG: putative quinol monooxygenase [Pseudomonadota bacterium]|nr:putative quinol monooxygenase [Pseudomonadota bacterium]